ncbi:MAG TPA: SHOCT domain-containing protein [Paenibacillus sp.]|uniref:SHOCT domain-containing protein n=1 Tax=Paenibacillus sp. TaxID=58172 RepID=UPI002C4067C7|nr:SHOCT domain-containing protein [Paenibacillus sp.]HUC91512.1 SHOCT domain-containing protein [Paenibacillus sp.]
MIFWVLIIGLVIYGVLLLLTNSFAKKEDPALQVLKERFARGEISEEEFHQKKSVLSQTR